MAGLAPAMAETLPPYYDDHGTIHYQGSGTFQCGRAPVALDGSSQQNHDYYQEVR